MSTIEASLTEIQSRLDGPEREWPEQRLTELLEQMGPAELSDWRSDIQALIDKFHKKRRRKLQQLYEARIGASGKGAEERTGNRPDPTSPSRRNRLSCATSNARSRNFVNASYLPVVHFLPGRAGKTLRAVRHDVAASRARTISGMR